MKDLLATLDTWQAEGRQVAVATVVKIEGTAPRPLGAKMIGDADGNMAGSVSGGCVEGAVLDQALETLRSGEPKLLRFGIADEMAWDVGLACGGTIEVFVEPLKW